MRAWQVAALTEPPSLALCEVERPAPGAHEYLIRVEACGLAFGDTLIVRGRYQIKPPPPFIPGSEVVGTIVEGPAGRLPVGTRVASSCQQGGWVEFARVPSRFALALPSGMAPGVALALRSNFPTSLYALREVARLRAGETVLVHAASGGVGSAAVALARWSIRSAATWVCKSLRCLAFGARYLIVGFAGGAITALPANKLLLHNATAHGVLWGEVRKRDAALANRLTSDVYEARARGALTLLDGQGFAFAAAPQAMSALHERRSIGKLWLETTGTA